MIWAALVLAYPALIFLIFATVAVAGRLGHDVVYLGRRGGALMRWVLAPLFAFHRVDAFTSGRCSVFMTQFVAEDLYAHELHHRVQCVREGGEILFALKYCLEYLRHGYRDNRFEAEARAAAGQQ
jgi:hypothetical protein